MKIFTIFAFIGLLSVTALCRLVHQATDPNKVFQYTQQTITLTWPGSFCGIKSCDSTWMSKWNGHSFTIHGLWPNSPQKSFIGVISKGPDPTCSPNFPFNLGVLGQATIGRLNTVWPDLTNNNFWAYEWGKHGTCYLKLLNDKVNKGLKISQPFADKVQVKYFNGALDLYRQITSKFKLAKGTYENSGELAAALGLQPNQVNFNVKNGKLAEMLICVSLPKNMDDFEKLERCNKPKSVNSTIELPGWKP